MKEYIKVGYEQDKPQPYYLKMGTYLEYFKQFVNIKNFMYENSEFFSNSGLLNDGVTEKEYGELENCLLKLS
jgi:hypothetical protein